MAGDTNSDEWKAEVRALKYKMKVKEVGFDGDKGIRRYTNPEEYGRHLTACAKNVNLRNFLMPLRGHKRILDWGCRTGYHMAYMTSKGHEVYGLELCEPYVTFGRERGNNIILGDMEKTDSYFEENYFDCVWANHSLEHVANPEQALQSLYKVCKAGATAVLYFPREDKPHYKHLSAFANEVDVDKCIPKGFNKVSLADSGMEWCLTLLKGNKKVKKK